MKNKNYLHLALLAACLLVLGAAAVSAQTTEFNYQGRLDENGLAATGCGQHYNAWFSG